MTKGVFKLLYSKNLDILSKIDIYIEEYKTRNNDTLSLLLKIQKLIPRHYIPEDVIEYLAEKLNKPVSNLYDLMTFYDALSTKPKGEHIIKICDSTVCRVNHSEEIVEELEKILNINMGETTGDEMFTLEYSACFGACDISPAIRLDGKVYGQLTPEKVRRIIEDIRGEKDEKSS